MTESSPWVRGRGIGRLLAQETNISDLLQFLGDRDATPWEGLVGFLPEKVEREILQSNNADLLLTAKDGTRIAIEVKLGHVLSDDQQKRYEDLPAGTTLVLAALSMDEQRLSLDPTTRWKFLGLVQLFDAWTEVEDEAARTLASQVVQVLRTWDEQIAGVFRSPGQEGGLSLDVLNRKFLARVVSRRIAMDLRKRRPDSHAGVTSGGGLPLVQSWQPVREENTNGYFMAEVRWWGTKPGGELRFGVEFAVRPGETESEELRRAAYELSSSMDDHISFPALKEHLEDANPRLAGLLKRKRTSRPTPKGDWDQVIRYGFAGAILPDGRKNNRQRTRPAFYGDGALRFQAIADIDFGHASGRDLEDLLDTTLTFLTDRQPT
jgi:hypothetical protein